MDEREAEVIGVYVGHCLVKCAGVVLASRVLGSPRKPPDGKAKKWVGHVCKRWDSLLGALVFKCFG